MRFILAIALAAAISPARASEPFQVTLLGTGNPRPSMERFGPATLIEVGDAKILVDAGRGAIQRLFQIGGAELVRDVDLVLLTHLHSDHVVGLPDLWLTGWVFGRDRPLPVVGPPGTGPMCEHLDKAFAFDKRVRGDGRYPLEGVVLDAREVSPGVAYESGGVTVTAFEVDHGDGIVPAYGYRVDYDGRSAAFSGDMRYDERIITSAKGVDLLVMEVISVEVELERAAVKSQEAIAKVISHHISAEQAGSLFARVKPRLAVYSHIVPSPAVAEDLIPPTRRTYDGPLAVGYDLMTIRIGETIEVYPRQVRSDR